MEEIGDIFKSALSTSLSIAAERSRAKIERANATAPTPTDMPKPVTPVAKGPPWVLIGGGLAALAVLFLVLRK